MLLNKNINIVVSNEIEEQNEYFNEIKKRNYNIIYSEANEIYKKLDIYKNLIRTITDPRNVCFYVSNIIKVKGKNIIKFLDFLQHLDKYPNGRIVYIPILRSQQTKTYNALLKVYDIKYIPEIDKNKIRNKFKKELKNIIKLSSSNLDRLVNVSKLSFSKTNIIIEELKDLSISVDRKLDNKELDEYLLFNNYSSRTDKYNNISQELIVSDVDFKKFFKFYQMDQITISLNAYQQVHKNLFKIHNHKNAIQKHYQLSKLINKCDSIDTCVRNEHIWDFDDYINHFGFKEFSIIVDNNGSKKKPYLYKKNEYYTYNISKSNRNTKFKSIRKLNNRLIKKHNIRELLYYSETISNLIVQKKWNILAKHFYQIYLKHDLTKTIELLKEISKINNLNIDTKNIKIVKEDRKALEKSFLSIEDN